MIAVETSTLIAYIQGDGGPDIALLENAIADNQIVLPPPVITEIFADPGLPHLHRSLLLALPQLEVLEDFWLRAALSRGKIRARKGEAPFRLALIAQSCIDHDVALITREEAFGTFAEFCGLRLA